MNDYKPIFRNEILRGEKVAWLFRWVLYGLVALLAAYVYFAENSIAGLYGMWMSLVALLYNGILTIVILRKRLVPQIRFLSVSLDVIFLTLYNGIDAWANSPLVPITTATLILYPVLLFLAALRLDRPLIIYATILSIISMNVLFFIFWPHMDRDLVSRLVSANIPGQMYRSIYVLLCGLLMLFIPTMVERLLRNQQIIFNQSLSLYELARHDALTGLPNRLRLEEYLPVEILRAGRESRSIIIAFMDLDGFKPVNDIFGHDAGDQVLAETGRRLSRLIRASDLASRVGGDEFVLILPQTQSVCDVTEAENRIKKAIAEPIIWNGQIITVEATIGFARFPEDGNDPDTLIGIADRAMLNKKQKRTLI
ncbi:MAG: GGDEF domain-containing protein [Spirochaetales bacterium]|nr:GGDEF domain-containing protein [Spirochaetales bacterium]